MILKITDEQFARSLIDGVGDEEKDSLLVHLLLKRENDGLNGRVWDAQEHLKHEREVFRWLQSHTEDEG